LPTASEDGFPRDAQSQTGAVSFLREADVEELIAKILRDASTVVMDMDRHRPCVEFVGTDVNARRDHVMVLKLL
jgi:hypothetical protein